AHELRNPLGPIRNAVEILRLASPEVDTLEHARAMIDRQVAHMARLLEDLLDVSRITQGKVVLHRERVALAHVVQHAADAARSAIERRALSFRVSLPTEPIWLDADVTRVVQIIGNLLSNAAKFTEVRGSVTLTAERVGEEIVLRVRDTGVGISPELLPHVFDLFVQENAALDRSQGGLGVGLTMVR